MASKALVLTYKTKIKTMQGREYIEFKRSFSRKHCPLKPHEHDYYNSDLFPGFLRRFAENIQRGRTWAYVDELPAGITIERGGFLSTVTYRETEITAQARRKGSSRYRAILQGEGEDATAWVSESMIQQQPTTSASSSALASEKSATTSLLDGADSLSSSAMHMLPPDGDQERDKR